MIGSIPGQRETTRIDTASEVKQPFQVFVRSCVVSIVMIWAAYAIIAMPWIKFGGWRPFFRFWAEWWPGLGVLPMVAVIYHGYVLLRFRYVPEQMNRNWPPPYEAVSVLDAGLLTVDNAETPRLNYDEPEPRPQPRTLKVTVKEDDGAKQRLADIPDLPGLPALAKALVSGKTPTERHANKYGGYSRREWIALRDLCLARQWMAWKNGVRKQGLHCTRTGLAVMRYVAKLPPTPLTL